MHVCLDPFLDFFVGGSGYETGHALELKLLRLWKESLSGPSDKSTLEFNYLLVAMVLNMMLLTFATEPRVLTPPPPPPPHSVDIRIRTCTLSQLANVLRTFAWQLLLKHVPPSITEVLPNQTDDPRKLVLAHVGLIKWNSSDTASTFSPDSRITVQSCHFLIQVLFLLKDNPPYFGGNEERRFCIVGSLSCAGETREEAKTLSRKPDHYSIMQRGKGSGNTVYEWNTIIADIARLLTSFTNNVLVSTH